MVAFIEVSADDELGAVVIAQEIFQSVNTVDLRNYDFVAERKPDLN